MQATAVVRTESTVPLSGSHILTSGQQWQRPPQETTNSEEVSAGRVLMVNSKNVIGWDIDTIAGTITLPPHYIDRLLDILSSFPITKKKTSLLKWLKFVGELRVIPISLPGARGLFSATQHAMTNIPASNRVILDAHTYQAIDDFRWMAKHISFHPTRIEELVPLDPSVTRAHDTEYMGTWGVFFAADHLDTRDHDPTTMPTSPEQSGSLIHHPVVWRTRFPSVVQKKMITYENPCGTITNSDLELSGRILHHEAIVHTFDVR